MALFPNTIRAIATAAAFCVLAPTPASAQRDVNVPPAVFTPVMTTGQPFGADPHDLRHYKTRMLVRRPADPRKFNGTVVLEWYNVTTGQDIDFNYGAAHEYLLRNGYAIVAVSAQRWCCDAQEVESRPLRRPHARSAAA